MSIALRSRTRLLSARVILRVCRATGRIVSLTALSGLFCLPLLATLSPRRRLLSLRPGMTRLLLVPLRLGLRFLFTLGLGLALWLLLTLGLRLP